MKRAARSVDTRDERYRHDPEYRNRLRARAKRYHAVYKDEPLYRELCNLRKKIQTRRDSLDNTLLNISKREKQLFELTARKEQLEREWTARRQLLRRVSK